jgi:hypothetical protein
MAGSEVRAIAGEPFPGPTRADLASGYRQEIWIYPAGDDAVFVVMENDRLKSVARKRVTMKDAAARVRIGMTMEQVTAAIGEPAGLTGDRDGEARATYLNPDAALDDLTIHYRAGRVVQLEIRPNMAIQR